jgi:hypothetical protein
LLQGNDLDQLLSTVYRFGSNNRGFDAGLFVTDRRNKVSFIGVETRMSWGPSSTTDGLAAINEKFKLFQTAVAPYLTQKSAFWLLMPQQT